MIFMINNISDLDDIYHRVNISLSRLIGRYPLVNIAMEAMAYFV